MPDQQARGPAMIAATSMLRPPPARVGKISDSITLPRSVELRKVFAGAAGLTGGLLLWAVIIGPIFRYNLESFITMFFAGALTGLIIVTVSPLRGESMTRWFTLLLSSQRGQKVELGGRTVHAYIGVAPLHCVAAGRVTYKSGAVDVLAGSTDERGVPVSAKDMRRWKLEMAGGHVAAPATHEGFSPLTQLGTEPMQNSRAETLAATWKTTPNWTSPPPQTGAAPSSPPPQWNNTPPPASYVDPFAQPAKKLPKK